MAVALAITPASGSITAAQTVCKIAVTGADVNDASAYSASIYPTEPEIRYHLLIDAPAGTDDGDSYVFTPASDGSHLFNNYIFPAAGSWVVRLRKVGSGSNVATLNVTVA